MKGTVAVYQGAGKPMELREYPLPDVGPDDILVRMRAANICGSDLHIWHGRGPGMPMNAVAGHEMVGEIFRLGRDVKTDCLGQPLRCPRLHESVSVLDGQCRRAPALPRRLRRVLLPAPWPDDLPRPGRAHRRRG